MSHKSQPHFYTQCNPFLTSEFLITPPLLLQIDLALQNFHQNLRYTRFLTQYHPETVLPIYWDMGYVLRGEKEEKYGKGEGNYHLRVVQS